MDFTEAHFQAVIDRLKANSKLADKTTDTILVDQDGYVRENYLLLLGGRPSDLGGGRQAGKQQTEDDALFEYTVEAVGISPSACRGLLDAASAQLTNHILTISGRSCDPLRYHAGDASPQPITGVMPPLYHARDQYTLRSRFTSGS